MTNSDILKIRQAGPDDLPTVVELIQSLADFENLPGPDSAAVERLRRDGFGPRPYFEVLLAEQAGRAIGYAFYFYTYSTFEARPTLYLEDLFVLPDYRGHGAGRAFIKHLAGIAVSRGCARLDWTVLDWNQPAISFYDRLGATQLPEWLLCRFNAEQLRRLSESLG